MCFRPADVDSITIKKVVCAECGNYVMPGMKCKSCGTMAPEQEMSAEETAPTTTPPTVAAPPIAPPPRPANTPPKQK